MVYYNENELFAAQWLRNLAAGGHIAPGNVDDRSIEAVQAADLAVQCHFFAGIGVWSYALRCAGWPDDRPVWTGSCPCQPFSVAGKRGGTADKRHLWPVWFRLIRACRPLTIFGEQVASPDGLAWFDAVCADLEGEGYAVGAVDLCAAGVGAPHIRQRLYWVAESGGERREGERLRLQSGEPRSTGAQAAGSGEAGGVVNSGPSGALVGPWSEVEWLDCTDGKARPTEPGIRPLADGAPGRVGRLRALGNALVAPVAVNFVRAYMEAS